jgi:urease accessory protein
MADAVTVGAPRKTGGTLPALTKLMAWLSPSFPTGAYAYSHGLEGAIADGTVCDAATLKDWLADVMGHGAGRSDAILFAHAYRAAAANDAATVASITELAAAYQPSRERHLESTAQGAAFAAAVGSAWPEPRLAALAPAMASPLAYPVAVAVAAAAHDVPLALALPATLSAFVANIVSAGVRAIPIGQTEGQRIIAALAPLVAAIAAEAASAELDELGGAAWRADIASMNHETLYTRLFRS